MEPQMSYILACDRYATIRPVFECLLKQTIKDQLEIVLVTPDPEDMRQALAAGEPFAAVKIVKNPVVDLAAARAAGVRAASAPIVFIGETHSFPHPELAAIVLNAFNDTKWICVVPSVYNANPQGALSWSGYISDYGRWAEGLPAGEIPTPPIYNAAYRSTMLLELGDKLTSSLGQSDDLEIAVLERGGRTFFEPSARIGHANSRGLRNWILNRLLGGNLVATNRSRHWPVTRRAVYIGGSFLIPVVLLRRLLPGLRQTLQNQPAPRGTLTAIIVGLALRAVGEALGYAGLLGDYSARGMHEYEVHKLKYSGPRTA
jgi:glycosyl transferase family 2